MTLVRYNKSLAALSQHRYDIEYLHNLQRGLKGPPLLSHSSNPSFDLSCLSSSADIFLKVISLRALPKGDGWSESNKADSDCESEADCVARAAKDCVDSRYLRRRGSVSKNGSVKNPSNLTIYE
jgi:hypothetical protein